MATKCKAHNHTPFTNMKTGRMFWKEEPCGSPVVKGTAYCLMHQDIQQREDAMRAALAPALASIAQRR